MWKVNLLAISGQIRQGDPLSSYIFLLCVKGLSFLLHKAEQNNRIHGIKVGSRCPSINHLLFADDSLLFSKASHSYCANILDVLKNYEAHSGQMINLDKSTIFFCRNTPHRLRTQIAQQMRISHVGTQDKYLSLPSTIQRSKKATFAYVKEKVNKKLQSWKKNLLSARGREILIKAVGTTIPIYSLA